MYSKGVCPLTPIIEHMHEPPPRNKILNLIFHRQCDAEAIECRLNDLTHVIEDQ
jgi:hypothetical protein